ncbi:MAG: hypothetical protein GY929_27545 [Actinomycetia bacterium]|nr:hypothetical protein [Actinomycetes bacterium]
MSPMSEDVERDWWAWLDAHTVDGNQPTHAVHHCGADPTEIPDGRKSDIYCPGCRCEIVRPLTELEYALYRLPVPDSPSRPLRRVTLPFPIKPGDVLLIDVER